MSNWIKTCQHCKKEDETTRSRTLLLKNYIGPCGDSFCWASCTMSSCKAVEAVVCDNCAKELKK